MEYRNTFRWLFQVFHFTGRKWHLPSPSRSQCSQLSQVPFSPALGARKQIALHLVISNSTEHSQQSTAPPGFKHACLTWFTVSDAVFVSTLIPVLQLGVFPRQHQWSGCSWVMMLRIPNPQWWEINHSATDWFWVDAHRHRDNLIHVSATSADALTPHCQVKQFAEKNSVCFTSVHPLSVLNVLYYKKKEIKSVLYYDGDVM